LHRQTPKKQTLHLKKLFLFIEIKSGTAAAKSRIETGGNSGGDLFPALRCGKEKYLRVFPPGRIGYYGNIGFQRLILGQRRQNQDFIGPVSDIFPGKLLIQGKSRQFRPKIRSQALPGIQKF
jgi:hypothetical protein